MALDDVRREWRDQPYTARPWTRVADQSANDVGECKGEFVETAGFPYQAYRKPGKIEKAEWNYPLPAYEKIAADLAYDAQCPVPAAQIWEKGDDVIVDGYACYCGLSLREYPQRFPWSICMAAMDPAKADPVVREILRAALARASGMLVFDTWLAQGDRGDHGANVQLAYDPAAPGRAQLMYLDFGRTMNWDGRWAGDGWEQIQICGQPALVMSTLDRGIVATTLQRIMAMDAAKIAETCNRLVGNRFPAQQAAETATALDSRRALLNNVLAPYL